MENEDRKIFETTFACFGIHVGLSVLLTVCLTVYDGLQHTLSFVTLYMEFGWIIPFALWFKVRDLLRRPASPKRIAIKPIIFFNCLSASCGRFSKIKAPA